MSLPSAGDWMRSPTTNASCLICGEPLGNEPHRITEYPHGVHERCRNWHREPFPLDAQLERLRLVARSLAAAYQQTVALGRQLRKLRDNWPPVRPRAALDTAEKERNRLRRALDTLRGRLWL